MHEDQIEKLTIQLLTEQVYQHLSPDDWSLERPDLTEVILQERLAMAIAKLNPQVPAIAQEQALKMVLNLPSQNLEENNEIFHKYLTEGVEVEYLKDDHILGDKVYLVDFQNIQNNDFLLCDQYTVHHKNTNRRPDLVLLVNGLPLVVIELKNATDENATLRNAFQQLQNYKTAIPQLFYYNALMIISDGLEARVGTFTAPWSRFLAWKSMDGEKEAKKTTPELETMVAGMLKHSVLLDLIKQFVVFERVKGADMETGLFAVTLIKKVAAYHQYYAVNKALESTKQATGENGDRKIGVVWHTQGSGKSLSMVFYTGKLVLALNNPTVVVLTDRRDLDDQLFQTFSSAQSLLRQEPVQAESRAHLKQLLKRSGGGIIFTTIQKFSTENGVEAFDLLSDRKNIVVIADEAHRSQYGFAGHIVSTENGVQTRYGNAKYLRDALPNASFIGFTGTPIEKEDRSTPAVFGNYIDVYDIQRAVEDGSTVRIFYESRLAKIHLKEEVKELLDEEMENIMESEESTATEKAKAKFAQLEAVVGHQSRLAVVAKDIVDHFEARQEVFVGKAMIVTMSRRIAVALYEEIIKIKPEWHSDDKMKGAIKVVMTSSSSDPSSWQKHHTNKQDRKDLAKRMKDVDDELKLVIVRDMWLTGFDAPCLHTMYLDKLMTGHNLMQAIARVNRVFKDKPGGLIVDYIGIASDLKNALAIYTESGGEGQPTLDIHEAIASMLEKFEIVQDLFHGFDYKKYFTLDTRAKLTHLLEAEEHILSVENGKDRFVEQLNLLNKLFVMVLPLLEAMNIKEDVAFFQAVKARLVKFEASASGRSSEEIDTAIRQLVDQAVVVDGVIDIFDAAGISKPDISILSEDFLTEVKNMKHRNLALELLKKILNDEIKGRSKKNLLKGRKFSEMLAGTIKRYHNNLLTTAQVLDELIKLAKDIKESDKQMTDLGLSESEMAFYDALSDNDSANDVLGDQQLVDLARVLVEKIKNSTKVDWTIKDSVQAKLRVEVRRLLRKYGFPPDKAKLATETVLSQAKLFADDWSREGK
jgi:type I restriction enzyme R subunit